MALVALHPRIFEGGEMMEKAGSHERLLIRFLSILP
jgi:hypothetical protein